MDFIVEEARKEMKRDSQNALIRKSLPYVTAFTAIVCVTVAGGFFVNRYYTEKYEQATRVYFNAVQTDNKREQEEKLREAAKTLPAPYAEMANIRLLAQDKAPETAPKTADKPNPLLNIAGAAHYPAEIVAFRELAALYEALEKEKDAEKLRELASRAGAEAQKKDTVFGYSLKEIQALALLQAGNIAEALPLFTALSADAAAPAELRRRSSDMADALGGGAAKPAADAPAADKQ